MSKKLYEVKVLCLLPNIVCVFNFGCCYKIYVYDGILFNKVWWSILHASNNSVPVCQHAQYQDPYTEAAKWNSATITFIVCTCTCPTVTYLQWKLWFWLWSQTWVLENIVTGQKKKKNVAHIEKLMNALMKDCHIIQGTPTF